MTLALRYAARSDRGLVRGNNQDSVYAGPRLLAVADGMGGHAAGDVASKVVIAALEHLDEDAPPSDMLQALRAAVFDGSEHLREVIRESPQLEGMGTTLTAVLFAGGRLALCHVGDSRAYLLRDGELSQITHDDTFVQTLIDDGRITQEEANHHPQRSLLLRALNGQDVDPDLSMREARAGDRYLLCSDGLSGVVSEETIATTLQDPDPQSCADRLIELALRSGGPDNITVIVADVVEDDGSGLLIEPVVDGAAGENVGQRAVDPGFGRRPGRAARPAGTATARRDPDGDRAAAGPAAEPPPLVVRPRRRSSCSPAPPSAPTPGCSTTGSSGVDEETDTVTVFRGINASVLGVDLYREEADTDDRRRPTSARTSAARWPTGSPSTTGRPPRTAWTCCASSRCRSAGRGGRGAAEPTPSEQPAPPTLGLPGRGPGRPHRPRGVPGHQRPEHRPDHHRRRRPATPPRRPARDGTAGRRSDGAARPPTHRRPVAGPAPATVPTRRGTELVMLAFAVVITLAAQCDRRHHAHRVAAPGAGHLRRLVHGAVGGHAPGGAPVRALRRPAAAAGRGAAHRPRARR